MSSRSKEDKLALLKWELAMAKAGQSRALQLLETVQNENARLRSLQFDPVTGLLVRQLFDRDAAHMLESRRGAGLLLVIDMDYLCLWNDKFGHEVGDSVLRHLATSLKQHGRHQQLRWYRTGGDELAGLLIGTQQQAEGVLKRARTEFEALTIAPDQPLPPSFIWGTCSLQEVEHAMRELEHACPEKTLALSRRDALTTRKQLLLQIADKRAYTAKIYRRMQMLAHMLQTDQDAFEHLGRWLFKGLGAIDRQAIVTLADMQGDERSAAAKTMIREMYINKLRTLKAQSRHSPGVSAWHVAVKQIVVEASLQNLQNF